VNEESTLQDTLQSTYRTESESDRGTASVSVYSSSKSESSKSSISKDSSSNNEEEIGLMDSISFTSNSVNVSSGNNIEINDIPNDPRSNDPFLRNLVVVVQNANARKNLNSNTDSHSQSAHSADSSWKSNLNQKINDLRILVKYTAAQILLEILFSSCTIKEQFL